MIPADWMVVGAWLFLGLVVVLGMLAMDDGARQRKVAERLAEREAQAELTRVTTVLRWPELLEDDQERDETRWI